MWDVGLARAGVAPEPHRLRVATCHERDASGPGNRSDTGPVAGVAVASQALTLSPDGGRLRGWLTGRGSASAIRRWEPWPEGARVWHVDRVRARRPVGRPTTAILGFPGVWVVQRVWVVPVAAAVLLVGCSQPSGPPATTSPSVSARTSAQSASRTPEGLVALGHSQLTGESSDPARPHEDALENSWATGSTPEVTSIYQRLVAARPAFKGKVANRAQGGATADFLAAQARSALLVVPFPALVIIQVIDNDIRCDGTDAAHVAEFGASLTRALAVITQSSPDSRILVVGQPGRPAKFAAALAKHPELKSGATGTGPCDLFSPSGAVNQANIAALTGIIEGYEAEQARVCSLVPQCHTDDGRAATFDEDVGDLILNHPTVHGHARLAELFWPEVARVLELT